MRRSVADLQDYLRKAAALTHETVELPPFALFLNPNDALRFYNYAIPLEPIAEVAPAMIGALRTEFARRERLLRFEFIEQYAPGLGPALASAGMGEEARNLLLVCTPENCREMPAVPGLAIRPLLPDSPNADLAAFISVQRTAFADENDAPTVEATELQVADLRRRLAGGNHAFLALLDSHPAGTGMFTGPLEGFAELVGIATLPGYRRRGIASALTGFMAQTAFASGVQIAFLTAADEDAGRVYQRVGFRPYATALAYCDR